MLQYTTVSEICRDLSLFWYSSLWNSSTIKNFHGTWVPFDGPEDMSFHHGRTITKDDTENWLTKTPPLFRSYGEALHKRATIFSTIGWSFRPFNILHMHYESCNDSTIKARPTARRKDLIYTHWWKPKRRYTNIISKNTTLLLFFHY